MALHQVDLEKQLGAGCAKDLMEEMNQIAIFKFATCQSFFSRCGAIDFMPIVSSIVSMTFMLLVSTQLSSSSHLEKTPDLWMTIEIIVEMMWCLPLMPYLSMVTVCGLGR